MYIHMYVYIYIYIYIIMPIMCIALHDTPRYDATRRMTRDT